MVRERGSSDELSEEKNKEKIDFQKMGIDFLGEKSQDKIKIIGGFDEKAALETKRAHQELTLSYLCDNSKLGFVDRDVLSNNLFNSLDKLGGSYKGKEVLVSEEDRIQENENSGLMRDFLQLNEKGESLPKRVADYVETGGENKGKKPKVESLNLSLAPPDVSLSLAGSNRVQNVDFPSRLRQSRSIQSLGPSYNTQTTYSNDFTAASLSYTCSHPYSHNASCSLTRHSTENNDQMWNCGEGTNGSVHSRFRPIGDGTVGLSNHGGAGGFAMGNSSVYNKDSCNTSFFKTASSENYSFFPSELPARPRVDAASGDSRGRGLESFKDSDDLDVGKFSRISRAGKIVRDIVSESIPVMAQIIQELTDDTLESAKNYLKDIIANPERKEEFLGLQRRLEKRSDLTRETLSKCQTTQLEILLAIKLGLGGFLSTKNRIPAAELVDIYLLERCRNINCRRVLPVDDCDCKICSTKKGFCSECMCPVCFNFDCASNTCSWVGCDVCSHWCHAACGLQKNLIKPGPSLKGLLGTTEMQFHCPGCGHASEMFGFVKDVFVACAKDWGLESLVKELDCVRKVFRGSEDRKGRELHLKADEIVTKLQNKMITPPDACNVISAFFNYAAGLFDSGPSSMPSKDLGVQQSLKRDAPAFPRSNYFNPKASFYNEVVPIDLHQNGIKASNNSDNIIKDEWSVKPTKKDGFASLESLVRVKDAEARMFQNRADEARREVESFKQMLRIENEKLEQEYSEKLTKLCVKETEERQRKTLEELKVLENSHCDYYNMKMRMQSDISGLLKRMEATKQQIV